MLSPLSAFAADDFKRLRRQIGGVHRKVDMRVDKARADCPIGEVDDLGAKRAAYRSLDLRNPLVLNKDLAWTS